MVTVASNYKTFLQPETIEKIDELIAENYHLDDMLEFIDEQSENDFVCHYEEYVEQGEQIGYEIVDAFVSISGIADVASAADAFVGEYQSEADFAEDYMNDISDIPDNIIVDWQATYDCYLRYDFDSVNKSSYGVYIFRSYY